MRGVIPPLPSTSPWRDTQLKHRDNFTFTFPFYYIPIFVLSTMKSITRLPLIQHGAYLDVINI